MAKQPQKTPSIEAFTNRAKSVLWRKDKTRYREWEEKITALRNEGHSKRTAIVQASLGFPELKVLFGECDVESYILDPEQMCEAADATARAQSQIEILTYELHPITNNHLP